MALNVYFDANTLDKYHGLSNILCIIIFGLLIGSQPCLWSFSSIKSILHIFRECYLWNADMEQLLVEAQHRWLRPAEICEILRNYKKFRIAPQPANMPPSIIPLLHCFFLSFNSTYALNSFSCNQLSWCWMFRPKDNFVIFFQYRGKIGSRLCNGLPKNFWRKNMRGRKNYERGNNCFSSGAPNFKSFYFYFFVSLPLL